MVEAVGHADGDLDPVVERLESGVGVAQLDRAQDVGPPSADLLGELDDLGDAAVGRPEHPVPELRRGLFDRVFEQVPQQFLELPGPVELALGIRVPQCGEGFVLPVGEMVGVLQCFVSMFVRRVWQCFSAVWADGFPRCRHRFGVMG